jgi:hypothetical protein
MSAEAVRAAVSEITLPRNNQFGPREFQIIYFDEEA